ncbi:MAG: BolA family transcriptional regulator [Rhodocyclaceae bacterium]|nr:BolA family transcriptional regulator [Rhodocyclaceae bacterium]
MSLADVIRERLAALEPTALELVDESHLHAGHAGARAGGSHFRLAVTSARFGGKSRLERQRLVYDSLGSLMRHEIHALSIVATTPDELKSKEDQ